ncbi:aromatic ring-hydroxylating dioxygenase subunit alpha [Pseudohalocynthiibacter aestuariivivens]|nr:aromatic ring-hydroxylating dioxygenase subunit alpha [Pseudohalocynthiibacter aestuariivivens]
MISDRTSTVSLRHELAACAAAPPDAPRGLPGQAYVDPGFFAHECATVLRRGWHCVGRADELPEQGDYLTLNLLDEPVVVVRDDTTIRALSNVCRHRGMPLVEGSGNTKRFVCRYHAWTYGTDGALLRAPRMQNAGFDAKTCKLPEFHCAQRFGFIYVCLADQAPDIDAELSGLSDMIGPYQPENYRIVHAAQEVWHCNWKCLVENFMEGYHLSVVHPVTLHGYTPTGLSRKGPNGLGYTSYFANYPTNIPSRGAGAPGLDDAARNRSSLFAAFPCQVASVAASLLVSLSILPLTATSIEVRWTMSVYGDELDDETIRQRVNLWEEVNREDREKLEAMQRALRSVHASGGPLAGDDYEGTVRDFLLWLARQDAMAG